MSGTPDDGEFTIDPIPTDIDPVVKAAEVLAKAEAAADALPEDDQTKAATLATIGLAYSNLASPQAAKSLRRDARGRKERMG